MSWDLRAKYAFDASEGQIPEGAVSVYGPANSHANCVPASFTAALDLLGLGDIDPQRVTNEIYGPNYRGGFGNFQRMIAWIAANVQGAPSFSDEPFNFDRAESAGQAGQLIIVAGWINPASVTFAAPSQANGFSHASLLVAHLAGDKYVIWNTWFGQLQTYDRAVLAASLYEMSITAGLHGGASSGGFGTLTDAEIQARFVDLQNRDDKLQQAINSLSNAVFMNPDGTYTLTPATPGDYAKLFRDNIKAAVGSTSETSSGSVDLAPVLDAIAALKADLATVKSKLDKDLA